MSFDERVDSADLRHRAQCYLDGRQPADRIPDTILVITELVQNVLQHTGDGGELALSRDDDTVLVEVYDRSSALPRLYRPDPRRIGGRGMLLVSAVSRKWGSRRTATGKVVWARMPVEPL